LSVVVILKEINNVSRALINYSVKDETFRVELVSILQNKTQRDVVLLALIP